MPISQVSVFLENTPGSMAGMMAHLDKFKIRIIALSIADAGEFGLVRMVTDEPKKVTEILEKSCFILAKSKKNTEVTAILITEKDRISRITEILGENEINIEYAYSSSVSLDGKYVLILRVSDSEKTEKRMKENNIKTLTLDEMKQLFQ